MADPHSEYTEHPQHEFQKDRKQLSLHEVHSKIIHVVDSPKLPASFQEMRPRKARRNICEVPNIPPYFHDRLWFQDAASEKSARPMSSQVNYMHIDDPSRHSNKRTLEDEEAQRRKRITSAAHDIGPSSVSLLQPETRPITQEQLVNEVKGIYAGLVMVEEKCVEIDQEQTATTNKLTNEQWQALIALHRTLLHEHQDFFLASQHHSASPALKRLATKYAMPARMWRHGIHSFLELLRHRLPDSLDHMLSFVYLAYSMMALLMESVPSFEDTWIECLGDLARYRMAIEEYDMRDREVWAGVARMWYEKAADQCPNMGRIQHHLAILARPNIMQQLFQYGKALVTVNLFPNARESGMLFFLSNGEIASHRYRLVESTFVKAAVFRFTRGSISTGQTTVTEKEETRVKAKQRAAYWISVAERNGHTEEQYKEQHTRYTKAKTRQTGDPKPAHSNTDHTTKDAKFPGAQGAVTHAGLVMVAKDYVEIDQQQSAVTNQSTNEHCEALTPKERRPRRGRGRRKNDRYWSERNTCEDLDPFDGRECLFQTVDGKVRLPGLANLDTGLKVPGGLIMSAHYAQELGRYHDIDKDFTDPFLRSISGHLTPITGVLRDVVFRLKGTSVTFRRDFYVCDAIDDMVDIMFGACFIKDKFQLLFERVKDFCGTFSTWCPWKTEGPQEKMERERLERKQQMKACELETKRQQKEEEQLQVRRQHSQRGAAIKNN